jgi:hypothetical protein
MLRDLRWTIFSVIVTAIVVVVALYFRRLARDDRRRAVILSMTTFLVGIVSLYLGSLLVRELSFIPDGHIVTRLLIAIAFAPLSILIATRLCEGHIERIPLVAVLLLVAGALLPFIISLRLGPPYPTNSELIPMTDGGFAISERYGLRQYAAGYVTHVAVIGGATAVLAWIAVVVSRRVRP